jgi:acetolactate synthase I/II/III large subunit
MAAHINAAQLLVQCLENEGVEYVFGIPGEENIHIMDALSRSRLRFVTTRHEQGAAFMADVYGRLTGRAGVCLATLGPGATNLITGVADANMDRAPLVAIAGQAATTRMHKESHQVLDLAALFTHCTKFSSQVLEPEIVPEVVRKAFKLAQTEKPGATFIEVPENVAQMSAEGLSPLKVQAPAIPDAPQAKVDQIARLIDEAAAPMVLVGNGVIRQRASAAVVEFVEQVNLPAAVTFMAKGAVPFSHPLFLGTIGLQAKDPVAFGLHGADLVLCVGYDMVEYDPARWNPGRDKRIVHIDSAPAEVDAHYILAAGVVGDIADALRRIAGQAARKPEGAAQRLHTSLMQVMQEGADAAAYPLKPHRVIADLRRAMTDDDVLVCDVGAHKLWVARLFRAERPNTCIISNGFAAMGIAVPGAIAAKLAFPDRRVVAVTGDGGFLMNSQELETAVRLGVAITVLVLRDGKYGVIQHHMDTRLGRHFGVDFGNPDLVRYAESFGFRAHRIESADELLPVLRSGLQMNGPFLIDCPIDYRENEKLNQALGEVICRG